MEREHSGWTGWRGSRAPCDYAAAVLAAAFFCALPAPALAQVEMNVVGTWGGAVNAVFVDEAANPDIAYIGSGRRLVTLNVADPANILELGSIDLGNLVMDLQVRNGYAYVADRWGPNYFCVVDVSNLADPRLVWSGPNLTGGALEVDLYRDTAYVRYGDDLRGFDVSNPEDPVMFGAHSIFSIVADVEIQGDLMYVVTEPGVPQELRIYDVINPFEPRQIGAVQLPGPEVVSTAVAVQGNYAYATTERAGGVLAVVDVSDPTNPRVLGSYADFNYANDVAVAPGGYVFVADFLGTGAPGSFPPGVRAWAKGLAILDVSTPSNPTLAGIYRTHGTVSGVEIFGSRAYVMDAGEGMIVLDISNPPSPVRLGYYHSPADIREMAKVGDTLYVSDMWNGFSVLDVSNPRRPTLLGVYQTSNQVDGYENWGLEVWQDRAHLSAGWAGIEVVDVSNPAGPALEGAFRFPAGIRAVALRLSENRDFAHVGAYNGAGSWFVNFSVADPQNITEIGSVHVGGIHYDYELGRNGVVFAAIDVNYAAIDTSDPANPIDLGHGNALGAQCVVYDGGDLVYVADDSVRSGGGLHVLNVTDPGNPVEVGYFDMPRSTCVGLRNDLAYLTRGGQLLALDVSDPAGPFEVGRVPLPGGLRILMEGRYAYITCSDPQGGPRTGLAIVELEAALPGDMNCDEAFNGADIDPFFLALGDPATYLLQFPNCDPLNGDMNGDGRLDGGDIDPFFECLGGGPCP